tara:strand:+ start:7785 stop:7976 length:192 start_codon:yes stop_codon:yes gene_type:complete
MKDNIIIYNKGIINIIDREPYETNLDVYRRGWYIINNKNMELNYNKLISDSIININKNKGMVY